MEFSVNHPIIFVLVGIVLLIVLGQSVFFLVRAIKRAKEKGMDMGVIKRTIKKAAVFTIAPAVSILLGVIALSRALGLPLPWLRLSVIGSLTYEQTAAANALDAIGTSFAELAQVIGGITAEQYITVAIVMTLGIIPGIIGVPLFCKNVEGGLMKIQSKDRKWGDILVTALFMGMISAFLGFIFCDVSKGLSGWIFVGVFPDDARLGGRRQRTSCRRSHLLDGRNHRNGNVYPHARRGQFVPRVRYGQPVQP